MSHSNPLFRRPARHGQRSEKLNAKLLGGRQTAGSGVSYADKGDIDLPHMLLENKATIHESLTLEHAWLTKITQEATIKAKTPGLVVNFTYGSGEAKPSGSWFMLPLHVAKNLGLL